jgi:26S proteasome regulatory subunit N1
VEKQQLAFMLARQHIFIDNIDNEKLTSIMSNTSLSEYFLALGQDLEIMEAKTPEDIYKTNVSETRGFAQLDSARQNLASTFVNAFVNAGFGQDKLMTEEGTDNFLMTVVLDDGLMKGFTELLN